MRRIRISQKLYGNDDGDDTKKVIFARTYELIPKNTFTGNQHFDHCVHKTFFKSEYANKKKKNDNIKQRHINANNVYY